MPGELVPEEPVPEGPLPEVSDWPVPEESLPPEELVPEEPLPEGSLPEVSEGPLPLGPLPLGPVPEGPLPQGPLPEVLALEGPVPQGPMPQVPLPDGPVPEESVPETPARDEDLAGAIDLEIHNIMQPVPRQPTLGANVFVDCEEQQLENRTFMFGTWHKTGTNLFRQTARVYNSVAGVSRCFRNGCKQTPGLTGPYNSEGPVSLLHWPRPMERTIVVAQSCDSYAALIEELSGGQWRGVVSVRDPVAILVSAYVYHMRANDCDGCDCGRMRKLDILEGLKLQKECMPRNVDSMLAAYRLAKANSNLLVVYFESIVASSSTFDDTMWAAFAHLTSGCRTKEAQQRFVALASEFDLRRNPHPPGRDIGGGHVSPAEVVRRALAVVMDNNLTSDYDEIRAELGYT